MRVKIDIHVHTSYSKDCDTPLEVLIKACQQRGLNGIAITDHNTIDGALALKKIAPPWLGLIIGEEIKTLEGEITGLFLTEPVPEALTPEETVKRIREQGGLVCIPHPFDRLRTSRLSTAALHRVAYQIDLIEAFNARNIFSEDDREAQRFARENGVTACAVSDAHSGWELGRSYIELEDFTDGKEFLKNMASAKLVMRRSSLLVHFWTKWAKFNKGEPIDAASLVRRIFALKVRRR